MIENTAATPPAPIVRPRKSYGHYQPLVALVTAGNGKWVAFLPEMIGGRNAKAKSTAFHNAAILRSVNVQTTSQHGYFYARLAPAPKAEAVGIEVAE